VPYELETVVELLSEMKRHIPPWHRIMRIQREIPAHEITSGVRNGNLRELVLDRARKKGIYCHCIRCREVALSDPGMLDADDQLDLREQSYQASGGTELFLSLEYRRAGKIAGFVRLRIPSGRAHRPELQGSAIVRELRVYGRAVAVGKKQENAWQHRGLGRWLMREAERWARENADVARVCVTSAVGTRGYYRSLGYERSGPYMAKRTN
jgi:elongator complex protein 3